MDVTLSRRNNQSFMHNAVKAPTAYSPYSRRHNPMPSSHSPLSRWAYLLFFPRCGLACNAYVVLMYIILAHRQEVNDLSFRLYCRAVFIEPQSTRCLFFIVKKILASCITALIIQSLQVINELSIQMSAKYRILFLYLIRN